MLKIASFLQTIGILIIIYAIVCGGLSFPVFGIDITSRLRETLPLGFALFLIGLVIYGGRVIISQGCVLFSPLLFVFSNQQFSGKTYFAHYAHIAELVILFVLFLIYKPNPLRTLRGILFFGILVGSYNFFSQAKDSLIFSDDLPSFLYRLVVLAKSKILSPSWDPSWNGGILTTDIYASGIITLFPIAFLLDTSQAFNILVWFISLILPAIVAALCLRILNIPAPSLGVILTLVSSIIYYRWSLKYGTLGFIISGHATLLSSFLLIRILDSSPSKLLKCSLFALLFLSAFWPLNLLNISILLALAIFKKKFNKYDLLIIFITIAIPLGIIFNGLMYSEHFSTWLLSPSDSGLPSIHPSFKEFLRGTVMGLNPVIIFLSVFAFFKSKWTERFLVLNYSLVALILGYLLPKFELERVVSHLGCLLAIMISKEYSKLILYSRSAAVYFFTAFLAVSMIQLGNILSNQSFEKFHFLRAPYKRFIQWASEIEASRFIFFGHMLHNFSGGHIYPLTHFTNREFWAAYPTHVSWKSVDIVPISVQASRLKLYAWIKFVEPQFIITDRKFWKRKLSKFYRRVYQFDNFSVYSTQINRKYNFQVKLNLITFSLEKEENEIIIPYRYYSLLRVNGCKSIEPVHFWGLNFIKLKDCSKGFIEITNKYYR